MRNYHGLVGWFLNEDVPSSTAGGITSVYNMTTRPVSYAAQSLLAWKLYPANVYAAFFLLCLLKDVARTSKGKKELVVPHHAPGGNRLSEAMKARNFAMSGMGQPMWDHVCAKCLKFYKGQDGNICK